MASGCARCRRWTWSKPACTTTRNSRAWWRSSDAVINLVAILHGSRADFDRVHVELPHRLVQACKTPACGAWCMSARWAWALDGPSNYLRSKAEGEAVLMGSGLDVTLLRPSVIFGSRRPLPQPVCQAAGAGAGDAAGRQPRALPAGVGGGRGQRRRALPRPARDHRQDLRMRRPDALHAVGAGSPGRPLVGPRAAADPAAGRSPAGCRPWRWNGCPASR